MKKWLTMLAALMALALSLFAAGCGGTEGGGSAPSGSSAAGTNAQQGNKDAHGKRILIAYFSRADENTQVGVIEKGNTRILAEMLAEMTGGDLFEIKPVKPYPKEYTPTTELAKQELAENARPEIVGPLPNVQNYDMIFLGYPIWWSDLPMAVYTFLDQEDFSGKTIAPFCTHEGSGLAGTDKKIADATGAKVLDALEMRGAVAQNERDKAKANLEEWVKELQ